MIDAEPCQCEICVWCDTPKDQRILTEGQVLARVDSRSRSGRWEIEAPLLAEQSRRGLEYFDQVMKKLAERRTERRPQEEVK